MITLDKETISLLDQYADAMTGRFSQLTLGDRKTRNQTKNGVVTI